MSYTVKIDELSCAGHGDCAVVAPQVFEVDDVAVVVGTAPDDVLLEAARSCPSVAITIVDEATGARVYP